MNSNQLHGKRFEDLIKGCGLFPGASDSGRSVTADFDIEAKFDKARGLPTSVKSTGSSVIGLSDARRFFALNCDFRMLVGQYTQEGSRKIFAFVYEFIVTKAALSELRGDLTYDQVNGFHQGLLLKKFPLGKHMEARKWAREQKAILSDYNSKIILNPKIDSKSQRRLQCSISLHSLIGACDYSLHTESIGRMGLPIIELSGPRKFVS